MADVTPDDVALVTSRSKDPVTINLIHVGRRDPSDPRGRKAPILKNGAARLVAPEERASAVVTLKGTPGDDVDLWRFGFIQLKFITDEWADYRGETETDGSMFLALDLPSCVDVIQQAFADSRAMHTSKKWEDWDVTH